MPEEWPRCKVFGVGLPRTGTTSLAAAFLELGYKTCHASFDDRLFERGNAFFDTPVYADYRRLDHRFPGSKFILTWREPHLWYPSFADSLGPYLGRLRAERRLSVEECVDRRCYALAFGETELAEEPFVARYWEHRRRVEAYFRDRPGDLLIVDVTAMSDPWDELCRFVDVPRPTAAFPRHNCRDIDDWMQIRHPNRLDPGVAASGPGHRQMPAPGGAAPGGRCRVSLTMIVRDEEEDLPACLESAAGLFDEVVIVDRGSTDRTVEVARSFGARVFEVVGVDDRAAARNAALARARGDYAFWLDADERIEPAQHARLRARIDGLRSIDAAYLVRCSARTGPGEARAATIEQVRLFPVREDVRWADAVDESLLPALRRAGVPVERADVVIRRDRTPAVGEASP